MPLTIRTIILVASYALLMLKIGGIDHMPFESQLKYLRTLYGSLKKSGALPANNTPQLIQTAMQYKDQLYSCLISTPKPFKEVLL